MRIDEIGNIGIGTSSPGSLLDVQGTLRIVEICDETGANCKDVSLGWGGAGDNLGDHIATANIQLNGNYLSGDGGSEGVYVNNSGQVGIGTSTPSSGQQLHVNGGGLTVESTASTYLKIDRPDGNRGQIEFQTAGAPRWYMGANNTTESGGDAGTDFVIEANDDGGNLLFTPLFIERSTGNLGIGTSSPSEKLHLENGVFMMTTVTTPATTTDRLYNNSGDLYWNGTKLNAGSGSSSLIVDADNDTKIDVEQAADEDIIRVDINGTEQWVLMDLDLRLKILDIFYFYWRRCWSK